MSVTNSEIERAVREVTACMRTRLETLSNGAKGWTIQRTSQYSGTSSSYFFLTTTGTVYHVTHTQIPRTGPREFKGPRFEGREDIQYASIYDIAPTNDDILDLLEYTHTYHNSF